MDVSSLAAAMMGAQTGRLQLAVAAKMMKMNADHDKSIVQMIQAGQENLNKLTSAASGLGQNLDISV